VLIIPWPEKIRTLAGFLKSSDVGREEVHVSRSGFEKVRNGGLSALSKKEQLLEKVCENVGCKDHHSEFAVGSLKGNFMPLILLLG